MHTSMVMENELMGNECWLTVKEAEQLLIGFLEDLVEEEVKPEEIEKLKHLSSKIINLFKEISKKIFQEIKADQLKESLRGKERSMK
jgi:hypothetical protein